MIIHMIFVQMTDFGADNDAQKGKVNTVKEGKITMTKNLVY